MSEMTEGAGALGSDPLGRWGVWGYWPATALSHAVPFGEPIPVTSS